MSAEVNRSRKEAEKLREKRREQEANNKLREEAKRMIVRVLDTLTLADGTQYCRKSMINKMMINWAERKMPDQSQQLRTYWTCVPIQRLS